MKPMVAISQWIQPSVVALLETFCQPLLNPTQEPLPESVWRERASRAEGLMVFMPDRMDEAFLEDCPNLRVVAAALKGYDNFDTAAMARRDITFCIQQDLLSWPTAELALALMLALGRNLGPGDDLVRSGAFRGWRPTLYGVGLRGRRVGLLGFGSVARCLARMLEPFQCQVLYHDQHRLSQPEEARHRVAWVSREELLASSHFLLPLLPLDEGTRGYLDRSALSLLRPDCLLVNVSRGSVVDEEAVAELLATQRLGGYAADVFAFEDWALEGRPEAIPPGLLEQRSNTFFTPHLGSADRQVRLQIETHAALQLQTFFQGHLPEGALNVHPTFTGMLPHLQTAL